MPSLASSKHNSKTETSSTDAASTHSTVSTATTLKRADSPRRKWLSLGSKTEPKYVHKSDQFYAQQAVHNEALASYFSMR